MHNNIVNSNDLPNPYYICVPSYSGTSAGIKVLHLLCHHLNLKGYPAFLANEESNYATNPELITPIADKNTVILHKQNNKTPIVLYPDITKGNPLNSKCTARYLLHYAGLLGGDSSCSFEKEDLIFTYTKQIGQEMGIKEPNVLFMPICNTDIFYPPKNQLPRKGSCFYASKYRMFSGEELSEITKDSVEITRGLPDSQTTAEVAELLRRSECFYSYEDTSLITEAILCGCPVILIKSKFFNNDPLAKYELGTEGCSFSTDPESIKNAQDSIPIAQQKFFSAVDKFWSQLDDFIRLTQELSLKTASSECNITLNKKEPKKKRVPIGRLLKKRFKSYLCLPTR